MKSKPEPIIDLQPDIFGGRARSKCLREVWARSRARARKAKLLFTIEPDDVVRMYQEQNGRCDVTGIPFNFEPIPDVFVKHPYAPSIDRRISTGGAGYTPKNVRLVCQAVNFGLGQWGQEVYLRLARAAVVHQNEVRAKTEQDWRAQQSEKITAAENILSLILDPAERRAQIRHIAALKAALTHRIRAQHPQE